MNVFGAALVLLVFAAGGATAAPGNADPDWPCQQARVGELSVASYWNGPVPDVADWRQNEAAAALARRVVQRRLPLEQAGAEIAAFAGNGGAEKKRALWALFAGVFELLNRERGNVLDGLGRFGQRQKTLAENLRREGEELRAAQTSDEAKVAELTQRLSWDTEFFEQRRQSLRFACEVPGVIEQRLYGLAQIIQRLID